MSRTCLVFLTGALLGSAASAREYRASNGVELAKACASVAPGDTVILRDGTWQSQELQFRGRGTAAEPITFRAETPGKVILTGQSSAEIDGEHLVVSGLWIQNGHAAKEGIVMRGHHCRLTESAVTDSGYKFYARLFGTDHTVDRCYFAGKKSESPTLQIEVGPEPNRHRIERNHFGPRPPLGRNGGETIRIGYSHQSMSDSLTTVEGNLFERCDGELEIISNKSCGNVYRGNAFVECAGMLTLRHGNRCRVEGNFFFGKNKRGSGGVRIIGEDHVVVNNYIEGVAQGAFWITAGIPDSPLVGYFQARNCVVAFNTVVDSRGPCIDVAAGLGSSGRTLLPEGIVVANNLFILGPECPLLKGDTRAKYQWAGNVFSGELDEQPPGFQSTGVRLALADGLKRFPADAEISAADGSFADVRLDIDGQPRATPMHAGCDQRSTTAILIRPPSTKDTGPAWRLAAPDTTGE